MLKNAIRWKTIVIENFYMRHLLGRQLKIVSYDDIQIIETVEFNQFIHSFFHCWRKPYQKSLTCQEVFGFLHKVLTSHFNLGEDLKLRKKLALCWSKIRVSPFSTKFIYFVLQRFIFMISLKKQFNAYMDFQLWKDGRELRHSSGQNCKFYSFMFHAMSLWIQWKHLIKFGLQIWQRTGRRAFLRTHLHSCWTLPFMMLLNSSCRLIQKTPQIWKLQAHDCGAEGFIASRIKAKVKKVIRNRGG